MIANYKIEYLSSFYEELTKIVYYIAFVLDNEIAANNLIDKIEIAIKNRSQSPKSNQIYKPKGSENDWYRIYIGNFTIFYTVKDNVMEIAHIIYSAKDINKFI